MECSAQRVLSVHALDCRRPRAQGQIECTLQQRQWQCSVAMEGERKAALGHGSNHDDWAATDQHHVSSASSTSQQQQASRITATCFSLTCGFSLAFSCFTAPPASALRKASVFTPASTSCCTAA